MEEAEHNLSLPHSSWEQYSGRNYPSVAMEEPRGRVFTQRYQFFCLNQIKIAILKLQKRCSRHHVTSINDLETPKQTHQKLAKVKVVQTTFTVSLFAGVSECVSVFLVTVGFCSFSWWPLNKYPSPPKGTYLDEEVRKTNTQIFLFIRVWNPCAPFFKPLVLRTPFPYQFDTFKGDWVVVVGRFPVCLWVNVYVI